MKIKVSDIATKVLEEDDEGYISFTIKALVENDSDEDIYFSLQGIDSDGFEILNVDLEGEIPRGKNKILTTRADYIKNNLFAQIVKWQTK